MNDLRSHGWGTSPRKARNKERTQKGLELDEFSMKITNGLKNERVGAMQNCNDDQVKKTIQHRMNRRCTGWSGTIAKRRRCKRGLIMQRERVKQQKSLGEISSAPDDTTSIGWSVGAMTYAKDGMSKGMPTTYMGEQGDLLNRTPSGKASVQLTLLHFY